MADIRIKDLATTAASTASDDFLAVDGSANGTRKLNAFSPTFGGNVVATGTLTVNSTTDSSSKDTGAIVTEGGLGVEKSASIGGNLTVSGTTTIASNTWLNSSDGKNRIYLGTNSTSFYQGHGSGVNHEFRNSANTAILQLSNDLSAALVGNLTVSGTGTSSVAGSLGVGTASPVTTLNVVKTLGSSGTIANSLLHLGSAGILGNIYPITFGYSGGSAVNPPAFIGMEITDGNSYTKGALVFGVRDVTTDTLPTERVRIFSNGNFGIGTGSSDGGQKLQVAGDGKFSGSVYAEKSGAGFTGQSTGLITQVTTVNSTTYNVTTGSAKVFVVQLASGDAALCYASYKSSTITILGSDGTIVNSSSPDTGQLGIYKSANDHVISFKTGSNALAGGYASWGFCFLGNPVISIA